MVLCYEGNWNADFHQYHCIEDGDALTWRIRGWGWGWLNLACTRLPGLMQPLQMLFGLTGTAFSIWLQFGRRLPIMIPSGHLDAPSATRVRQYKGPYKQDIQAFRMCDAWWTDWNSPYSKEQIQMSKVSFTIAGPINFFFWTNGTISISAISFPGKLYSGVGWQTHACVVEMGIPFRMSWSRYGRMRQILICSNTPFSWHESHYQ